MKILSIQYGNPKSPYARGGLANALHQSLKHLTLKHEVTCYTGLFNSKSKRTVLDGIKYIQTGLGTSKYTNRFTFSLLNSSGLSLHSYDLIIIVWDRYAPIFLSHLRKVPIVLELHAEYFTLATKFGLIEPLSRASLRWNLKRCRYLVTVSEGILTGVQKYTRNLRLSSILPPGISLSIFNREISHDVGSHLLFLGRLDIRQKGLDVLLKAYKQADVDLPLVIAGDGPDRLTIEKMIADYGLGVKVRMVGWVDDEDKYQLLQSCRCLCLPSRGEGWATVVMEAAAAAKPTIGTRVPGLVESVVDGQTGLLVELDNVRELAQAISILANDSNLSKQMGDAAREIARPFAWEAQALKREKFFLEVIDDFSRCHN